MVLSRLNVVGVILFVYFFVKIFFFFILGFRSLNYVMLIRLG